MSKKYGILLVSHVEEVAVGIIRLIEQVAADVTIKPAGGTEDGRVGTSFDRITEAIATFEEDTLLAFYDLGSAKMNIEIAMETTDKTIILYDTAFIEGAYVAASLLQTGADLETVEGQLESLIVK